MVVDEIHRRSAITLEDVQVDQERLGGAGGQEGIAGDAPGPDDAEAGLAGLELVGVGKAEAVHGVSGMDLVPLQIGIGGQEIDGNDGRNGLGGRRDRQDGHVGGGVLLPEDLPVLAHPQLRGSLLVAAVGLSLVKDDRDLLALGTAEDVLGRDHEELGGLGILGQGPG